MPPARSPGSLLMASLPEANGAVKGLTKLQVVENLVAPLRSAIEFDEAFEQLRGECWYLHRRDNDAWVFAKQREPAQEDREVRRGRRRSPRSTPSCSGGSSASSSPPQDRLLRGSRAAEDRGHQDRRRTPAAGPQPRQEGAARGRRAPVQRRRPEEQLLHPHRRRQRPRQAGGQRPSHLGGRQGRGRGWRRQVAERRRS